MYLIWNKKKLNFDKAKEYADRHVIQIEQWILIRNS